MSMQIHENAVSEKFFIDYSEKQVTVRPRLDCTGWIMVHVMDHDDTLQFSLQHDSESCPIHEVEKA